MKRNSQGKPFQIFRNVDGVDTAALIFFAMIVGRTIVIGYPATDLYSFSIPIWSFPLELIRAGVLDSLKVAIFAATIWLGFSRGILIACAAVMTISWLGRYSYNGAFVPQVALSALFIAASMRLPEDRRSRFASMILSAIFISAGLQKINSTYLSGVEFLLPSGFAELRMLHFDPIPEFLATRVLPWSSILIELTIGIGILISPILFSHIAMLFIFSLSLSSLHPPIFPIYISLGGLCLMADRKLANTLSNSRIRWTLGLPFIWCYLILFSNSMNLSAADKFSAFGKPWIVAATFFVLHLLWLIKCRSDFQWPNWRFEKIRRDLALDRASLPTWVVLALIPISYFAFLLGAPIPIGYSMFSGQSSHRDRHEISIGDTNACSEIDKVFRPYNSLEVRWRRKNDSCWMAMPTIDGREEAIRQICKINSDIQLSVRARGARDWTPRGCPINP